MHNLKKVYAYVGTYREPCLQWIREKLLYNIPVFGDSQQALRNFRKFTRLNLVKFGSDSICYALGKARLVGHKELQELHYPLSKKPHSDTYVLFELKEPTRLDDETCLVFTVQDFAKTDRDKKLVDDFLKSKTRHLDYPKRNRIEQILPAEIIASKPEKLALNEDGQLNFLSDLFPERKEDEEIADAIQDSQGGVPPRRKYTFRLGELFCGPGGIACGAMRAMSDDKRLSIAHAWANDYDADTCKTYRMNICPENPNSVHCGDVRHLNIAKLGPIDAFCYGFPCNSFSQVGEHKGLENEKFGQLYWYGIKVLKAYRPKWFLAENVSGIRSSGAGDFQVILNDMREAGYKLTVNLYKSEQYGIPQKRHRVIVVGIRDDLKVDFKVPSPKPFAKCDISARTALANIPPSASNNESRRLSKDVVRRLSLIQPGENVWQAEARLGEDFPEELKIKTRTKISQIYRKLHPDQPAYTVTAAGGGGTFMYHWTNRELTNRERARIQAFPDDYQFYGDYSSVRKQIGMAVPCKLSEIVITAILNSFAGIEYPSVEPNLED